MTQTKSRLIYTAGTFAIPAALAVCRRLIITLSVLRKPDTQLYQNEKSNPPKGFLGYASLFVNEYCDKLIPLEFSPQTVLVWDNPAIQLYYSIICTGINNSQVTQALGAAMTPPAIVTLLPAIVAAFPGCLYTNIKFKLLPGTRLQVDAVGEEVVSCAGVTPQSTPPDTSAPATPYPADRARSEDPARSLPEDGELPGDTAPTTIDDPDLGVDFRTCFKIIGTSATVDRPVGSDVVSTGTQFPSWVKANSVLSVRALITSGYYVGCYGYFAVIDGVTETGFSASPLVISADDGNPNCPA